MAPCESCHAGCCRSFAVPVSGADIINIERRLHLRFEEFVCRWPDPSGRIARNYAPHVYFSDAPRTPFVVCLDQTYSTIFPQTAKCRFLLECPPDEEHPLGQARCGIYGARPSACRVFPSKFNSSGDLAVIYDVPQSQREGKHPITRLCPRPWVPEDLDALQALQDLAVAKFEMEFFSKVASIWNRSPRHWNVFGEFLHLVYSQRIQKDDAASAPLVEAEIEDEVVTLPFPTVRPRNANRAAA